MKCMKYIRNIEKIDLIIIIIKIIVIKKELEDMNIPRVNHPWVDMINSPGKELSIDGMMNILYVFNFL